MSMVTTDLLGQRVEVQMHEDSADRNTPWMTIATGKVRTIEAAPSLAIWIQDGEYVTRIDLSYFEFRLRVVPWESERPGVRRSFKP
jgi:hypothetical protein